MGTMKVAKCDEEDLKMVGMLNALEDLFDSRPYRCSSVEGWMGWSDDCEEKKLMQECFEYVKDEDGEDWNGDLDHRLVVYRYVKNLFMDNPSALARVLICAEIALENCFDKEKDYIDYNPTLQKALDYYEDHKEEVDAWYESNYKND